MKMNDTHKNVLVSSNNGHFIIVLFILFIITNALFLEMWFQFQINIDFNHKSWYFKRKYVEHKKLIDKKW